MRRLPGFLGWLALVVVFPSQSEADDLGAPRESLEVRIDQLRNRGEYCTARSLAKSLHEALQEDPSSQPYEIEDANCLQRFLGRACELSPADRDSLAWADRMEDEVTRLWETGDAGEGAEIARRQLDTRRRLLGAEEPLLVESAQMLGYLLHQMGRTGEAEKQLAEAVETARRVWKAPHPILAEILTSLGAVRGMNDRPDEAEANLREAVAVAETLSGNDAMLSGCLANLAAHLESRERWPESAVVRSRLVDFARRTYGESSVETATEMNRLGNDHREAKNCEEAEAAYREAAAVLRSYGPSQRETYAQVLNNMTFCQFQEGKFAAADTALAEIISIRREVLGPNHPFVRQGLENRAQLHQRMDDPAGAARFLREAIRLWEEEPESSTELASRYGWLGTVLAEAGQCEASDSALARCFILSKEDDLESRLNRLYSLAECYARQDRTAEAIESWLETLRIQRARAHPDSARIAATLSNLAGLEETARNHQNAERLARESLSMRDRGVALSDSGLGALFALALSLDGQGRYTEAEALYREALTLRMNLPDSTSTLTTVDIRMSLLTCLTAQELWAEAELVARDLVRQFGQDGHAMAMFPPTRCLLHPILLKLKKYDEAEPLLWTCFEKPDSTAPKDQWLRCALDLAELLQAQSRYSEAESVLTRILRSLETGIAQFSQYKGLQLSQMAVVCHSLGRYGEGTRLAREALAEMRAQHPPDSTSMVGILSNLAGFLLKEGKYSEAEQQLLEALEIARALRGERMTQEAAILQNLGDLRLAQGDLLGSLSYNGEAHRVLLSLPALNGRARLLDGAVLNDLGLALYQSGQLEPSAGFLRRAIELRSANDGEIRGHAESLDNLAMVLHAMGRTSEADSLYLRSLALWRRAFGPCHPELAVCLRERAKLLWDIGKRDSSRICLEDALECSRQFLSTTNQQVWNLEGTLGWIALVAGDFARAESLLTLAAKAFDESRVEAGKGLERATFSQSPYGPLAAVRLSLGKGDQAWAAVERAQGRVLADLLLSAGQRPLSARETARGDSLRTVLVGLEEQLEALMATVWQDASSESRQRVEQVKAQLLEAQRLWGAFQLEMTEKYPVAEGQAFPIERVQAVLGPEQAIIGWLDQPLGDSLYASWGYLIRAHGPAVWARMELPGGARSKSPFSEARSYGISVSDPRNSTGITAEKLWFSRIRPLSDALVGVNDLIVIPSGAMAGVPIEALMDTAGVWLSDHYRISYAPSATIYTWLQEKHRAVRRPDPGPALLVGDPPFRPEQKEEMAGEQRAVGLLARRNTPPDSVQLRAVLAGNEEALNSLPRLPGTREEVRGIASLNKKATSWLGLEATEPAFFQAARTGELKGYETIHIATHAAADPWRPERSCLILSRVDLPDPRAAALAGDRIYDGVLTAKEILGEWTLDADLVGLSGCETALGAEVSGEGTVGLSNAFFQVGARSLLVSLWSVSDRSTAMLMKRFYENWWGKYEGERAGHRGRMTKTEALQEAKAWLRTQVDESGYRYDHPYFWAPFILVGERE